MAQVTKSVQAAHGLTPHLIPATTLAKLSQGELTERLAYVADLNSRADRATNHVIADCYRSVAKAALTALPPAELDQQLRARRAKARSLGSGPGDALMRQADELEAQNPMPPRASVRKAQGGEPTLRPCYDRNGVLFGVADEADITPVTDPDVIAKAAGAGMAAVFSDQGKAVGFARRDAITTVGKETAATAQAATASGKELEAFAAAHGVSANDLAAWLGQHKGAAGQPGTVAKAIGRQTFYDQDGRVIGHAGVGGIFVPVVRVAARAKPGNRR
jgi:hypothetical protein